MGFAGDFVWGVASASYQVEGAALEDGKGPSVWDTFCRKEGAVWHGQTGDVACNHYHRYKDDVALMGELGIGAYRLSVSWPRVMPEGTGAVNRAGLDFYNRLVDECLAVGVEPWVTLFHWDYPLALYHRGGWLNRDSADWFAEYAGVVVEALSDRVSHWMTLNEPRCFVVLGHGTGLHAPGLQMSRAELMRAGHHALLAHGRAVKAIREGARTPPAVGVASATQVMMPATDDPADLEAARRGTLDAAGSEWDNAWWMDPLYVGRYPVDPDNVAGVLARLVQEGDMATIAQPLDFCGLNIYSGRYCRAGEGGEPVPVGLPAGYVRTAQDDWTVAPESLYHGPRFFHERYGLPIVITENGHQNLDGVSLDGRVHDPQRIDYLHRYLLQLRRAADDGVPVRGYFQWTLMDNFEWAFGYKVRVGLVHTDYQTLRRTPKDSFHWYRDVVASNGADL